MANQSAIYRIRQIEIDKQEREKEREKRRERETQRERERDTHTPTERERERKRQSEPREASDCDTRSDPRMPPPSPAFGIFFISSQREANPKFAIFKTTHLSSFLVQMN